MKRWHADPDPRPHRVRVRVRHRRRPRPPRPAHLQVTESRLLDNQVDIGNAIKPFYGRAAGNRLTALLKEHIIGAVALLQAARSGNQQAVAAASTAWYAKANRIADWTVSAGALCSETRVPAAPRISTRVSSIDPIAAMRPVRSTNSHAGPRPHRTP